MIASGGALMCYRQLSFFRFGPCSALSLMGATSEWSARNVEFPADRRMRSRQAEFLLSASAPLGFSFW